MEKRDSSIDIAKSIGIILVVLGHTKFKYAQFIYQFHLPLFFFLSGVVFNEKRIEQPKTFIVSKIKSLYVPFIKFELIFLVFHNLFTTIGFYSKLSNTQIRYDMKYTISNIIKILIMGSGEQLAGPLWFLISSLEIIFIFALLVKISTYFKKYSYIFLIAISVFLYYVGCYTNLPRMMSQSFIGLLFFSIGFMYRKYNDKIKFSMPIALCAFLILLVCTKYNHVDISQLAVDFKWMLIISGVAGTYLVIYISKLIKKGSLKSFLVFCGKNTIYVLALHCISFKLVMAIECTIYNVSWEYLGMFPTYEKNVFWCIPLTIIGTVFPLFVKYIINQITLRKRD